MAYSRSEKEKAMVALAAHAGNAKMTADWLKAQQGVSVIPDTLRKWRQSDMREFYDQLLEDRGDLSQTIINETLETALLAAQAERLAIEAALHDLRNGACKDPAKTARDLSHIKAMNVDKYLTLQGRPTSIVEVSNPDEALLDLVRLGVLKPSEGPSTEHDADGEAFEVPDDVAQMLLGPADLQ